MILAWPDGEGEVVGVDLEATTVVCRVEMRPEIVVKLLVARGLLGFGGDGGGGEMGWMRE